MASQSNCQDSKTNECKDNVNRFGSNDGPDIKTDGNNTTEELSTKDGFWSWVVVASCFAIHFIVDGTYFTFGVILVDIREAFECSDAAASWIGSLQASLTLILGKLM